MKINLYEIYVNFLIKNKPIAKKMDKISANKIENIVVYSNTAIGDTLFNTPVLRALKKKYPLKKIIIVLNPNNYILFENNPYVDKIFLYDGKWKTFFKILNKLKEIKIDLTLILHSNEPQATPLALLSGSKYIIKIPNKNSKYEKFHNNKEVSLYYDRNVIYDRLRTLEYLNIKKTNPRMELFLNEKDKLKVNKYFLNNKINKNKDILIGFQIGASNLSRMWFEERWVELAKKLLEYNLNIKIIITGAPTEIKITNSIFNILKSDKVFNLTGVFDLRSAAALIGELDLLITPDTGPLHIAAALKIPTVTLFAVAKWYVSNPCFDEDIHLYIQKDKICKKCISKKCKFQKCMLQISAEEVFKEIKFIIKNKEYNII